MDLILELLCEEIPARMQLRALDELKLIIQNSLKKTNLNFSDVRGYVTSRRLAIIVEGLPKAQDNVKEERRGPKTDAPEKAIKGFLKSNNVTLEHCEKRKTEKGEFWFFVIEKKGLMTDEVLKHLLPEAIQSLQWPKSMRWGDGTFRWVRPLRRIMCVLNGKVLPIEVGEGIPCGNITSGHRFMGSSSIEVSSVADYEHKLKKNKVVIDVSLRKKLIVSQSRQLADAAGFVLKNDPKLLEEVSGLIEWPVPLLGKIDEEFMMLPDEVLITSMRTHQKYFSVLNKDGSLAPRFVMVSNIETKDHGIEIIKGNERVLKARLADAKFFWEQDKRHTLESRFNSLSQMMFHKNLGNLGQKVERVERLSTEIAKTIGTDPEMSARAAHLCKADLMTGMVAEFPSLQGTMGYYYALADGENIKVAQAIKEHYAPAGPEDACPTAPISVVISIADKMDTLVGFFGMDERPTGSRDPFGLRRASLGIIRLILQNNLNVRLSRLVEITRNQYIDDAAFSLEGFETVLLNFFVDRLKVYLRAQGVRHDLIEAVFQSGDDDLLRLVQKANALAMFIATDDGENLLTAYKRARNIVGIEEQKDGTNYGLGVVEQDKFVQTEEKLLWTALGEFDNIDLNDPDMSQFEEMLAKLANLRVPVDNFFDKVIVNCDDADLRRNRLLMLSTIGNCLDKLADFSCIER